MFERLRAIISSWNRIDRTKIGPQVIIVQWILIMFGAASLNAILSVILLNTVYSAYSSYVVLVFLVIPATIAVSLSIGGTIYLSGIGEKRVLGGMGINSLAIPIAILLEYSMFGQSFPDFVCFFVTVWLQNPLQVPPVDSPNIVPQT